MGIDHPAASSDDAPACAELVASRSADLAGTVTVPGDKSISHRALILAAMIKGTSRIGGLSDALDVQRTRAALAALGCVFERSGGSLFVTGGAWHEPAGPIDCGNSGTTARLLMGALAGRGTKAELMGDGSLSGRPMARVTDPLRAMGAKIEGGETLPLRLRGGELRSHRHVNRPPSAQVKSALLLAGLNAGVEIEIAETQPTRDHLERMLPIFGVAVEQRASAEGSIICLPPNARMRPTEIDIPGDMSSAAFPLAAALLCTRSEVTVQGVGTNPLRTGIVDTLNQMGADIRSGAERDQAGEPVADLTARTSRLRGVTVSADQVPRMIDEYPILAIAAASAEGETVMHGLAELRVKESDRLAALADGLTACGVRARIEGDSLRVTGGPVPGGTTISTQGDHRIAMAFLVLGLVSEAPIRVNGADMIATSFPGFAALMRSLGARIEAA
jgi:3-phosphoshikimate 1-carboxyvinyltransferase